MKIDRTYFEKKLSKRYGLAVVIDGVHKGYICKKPVKGSWAGKIYKSLCSHPDMYVRIPRIEGAIIYGIDSTKYTIEKR